MAPLPTYDALKNQPLFRMVKKEKCCRRPVFFFTRQGLLEINRLDKIARRTKRVGGAIADLWGSLLVGTYL